MFAFLTNRGRVALLFVLLLVSAGRFDHALAQSTGNSYLEALEGEASGLALDDKTRVKAPPSSRVPLTSDVQSDNSVGNVGDLVPGLSIDQFEAVLKRNYIGSYLFFSRLSDASKQDVFSAYQANPSPDAVRANILKANKK